MFNTPNEDIILIEIIQQYKKTSNLNNTQLEYFFNKLRNTTTLPIEFNDILTVFKQLQNNSSFINEITKPYFNLNIIKTMILNSYVNNNRIEFD